MRFSISHETVYRYSTPASYTIQVLRKTPRPDVHQRLIGWRLEAPGELSRQIDAYGNVTDTMTLTAPHNSIRIRVSGTVEIAPLFGGRLPEDSYPMSPLVFRVATPLTQPDAAIEALAREALPQGLRAAADALRLAERIRERVAFEPGHTEVTSPAAQALEIGRGVCQDHAHLFVSACRVLGVPARYVSGYVYPAVTDDSAGYAWADLWLDGSWFSVDVSQAAFAGEHHCRIAIGRDYDSAAPVRGVRTGGGYESLETHVSMRQVESFDQ